MREITVCSSKIEYVLCRIRLVLYNSFLTTQLCCSVFLHKPQWTKQNVNMFMSSVHKKKHRHNFNFCTQMHDFKCVFNVDSCLLLQSLYATTNSCCLWDVETWRENSAILWMFYTSNKASGRGRRSTKVFISFCNRSMKV